ncbi:MAG: glycosyltransferase family 9 protein [Cyclobacteriaceae bacterium]
MPGKKILIIRFSSIGDIVLTTPVIRILKTQLENVELHYFCHQDYVQLLIANPHIDKIHLLKGSLGQAIHVLKQEKFDYVIDLQKNFKSFLVKFSLGAPSGSFRKLNIEKWLLVNFKMNRLPNVHIVDRYVAAAKPLGVHLDDGGLDYFIPHKDVVEDDWLPEAYRENLVAFVLGGKFGTKKLPKEKVIEVCDKINKPVILLGGKEEEEVGQYVADFFEKQNKNQPYEKGLKDLNKKTIIFNGCGKFNLNQSASIIKKTIAVFTHDTGLMHIAAAFGKDVFSIWGNTIPEFGMYPYRTKFTVFENNSLSCRPCSKIGSDKCPLGHFDCMKKQVMDFYIP